MEKTETNPFPIQIGQSITCDFDENTWTLKMPKGFCWTGGKFALVPTEQFEYLNNKIEELRDTIGIKSSEILKSQSDNKKLSDMCDELADRLQISTGVFKSFGFVETDNKNAKAITKYKAMKEGGTNG